MWRYFSFAAIFFLVIFVTACGENNDSKPSSISYAGTPFVFTVGQEILPLTPVVKGGDPDTFSVIPALPAGLDLDEDTGIISGTPVAEQHKVSYTVTAANAKGKAVTALEITVQTGPLPDNDTVSPDSDQPADPDVVPDADSGGKGPKITYSATSYTWWCNNAVTTGEPNITGDDVTLSYSGTLPAGLTFNAETGEIHGVPDNVSGSLEVQVIVKAENSKGAGTVTLSLKVRGRPEQLGYPGSPFTLWVGNEFSAAPSVIGEDVSYQIIGNLPDGLSFSPQTGVISGTPVTRSYAPIWVQISAENPAGIIFEPFDLLFAHTYQKPANLSYGGTAFVWYLNQENPYTLTPAYDGDAAAWAIDNELPEGISFNEETGVISGTPVAPMEAAYTVTASGGGQDAPTTFSITVKGKPQIAYSAPEFAFWKDTAVSIVPSVALDADSWTVSECALPAGIAFSTANGSFSGTAPDVNNTINCVVSASNPAGTTAIPIAIRFKSRAVIKEYGPDQPPYVFVVDAPVSAKTPEVTAGSDITGATWSITPDLSANTGLSFNTATGTISGTPNILQPAASYSVTVTNQAGQSDPYTFSIAIVVPFRAIFVTSGYSNGDLGGIPGADHMCMNDENRPSQIKVYRAMLSDAVSRIACVTPNCSGDNESVDWVLEPDTYYARPAGDPGIGTTTGKGIFTFPFENSITPGLFTVWTGLYSTWQAMDMTICNKWTSSSSSDNGNTGLSSVKDRFAIENMPQSCDGPLRLYCVEQGPDAGYRISGTVSGLGEGKTVSVTLNQGEPKMLSANGIFTFPVELSAGDNYSVEITAQPEGQECHVNEGMGTIGNNDVVLVSIICM